VRGRGKQFIEERHAEILRLLKENGRVTVPDLREKFSVSVATVRSDLDALERMGKVRRTHGGAIAEDRDARPIPFGTRRMLYGAEKTAIGRAAAGLVKDGEVIFIDGGTTAVEMRQHFGEKQGVTIITPSIEVAYWLVTATSINVYLLNGFLNRDSLSTTGVPVADSYLQMNISKAFCGAAGLTIQDGLTDLHAGFVEQKRVICQHARMVIGLVDHSKVGVTSLASFAAFGEIDAIVTDRTLPPEMAQAAGAQGIEVLVV
jgi:DeoR/GlpR family transcriptional regulator of sugar metabolism